MIIKHFLILGAGASYGARGVGTGLPKPPLGADLAEYLELWLDANNPDNLKELERVDMENERCPNYSSPGLWQDDTDTRLEEFLAKAKKLGFEIAAEELWRKDRELAKSLNLLMAWSMLTGKSCSFPEHPDRFDNLLQLSDFSDELAVITLNYDLLLEEAVQRLSAEPDHAYFYPGLSKLTGRIPIFKIHGSINWLQHYPLARSASNSVAERMVRENPPMTLSGPDKVPDTQQEYVPTGERTNLIAELKHDGSARNPILGIYAPGKPIPYNCKCIGRVRSKCLKIVDENQDADVTIIGVHITKPGDDPRLDEVLDALGGLNGEKRYVGPDENDRDAADNRGFRADARYLHELIKDNDCP